MVVSAIAKMAIRLRSLFEKKLRFISVRIMTPPPLLCDPSVFDADGTVCLLCDLGVMSDHDDGLAVFPAGLFQQVDDLIAGLAVQIPGWLIRQDDVLGGGERTEKIYCVIFRATSTSMQCRCGIPLLVQSKICSSIFSIFQS